MTPHKHAVLIKAWADGAKIEVLGPNETIWFETDRPTWSPFAFYRIKKEPAKPKFKFKLGDYVWKKSGSEWAGYVVGTYSTQLTPEGYAVESKVHKGSVQIYPAAALTNKEDYHE